MKYIKALKAWAMVPLLILNYYLMIAVFYIADVLNAIPSMVFSYPMFDNFLDKMEPWINGEYAEWGRTYLNNMEA